MGAVIRSLIAVMGISIVLFAHDAAAESGLELELEKVKSLLEYGQGNADSYSERCKDATGSEFTAGLEATWNAGGINSLQCLNRRIEGTLVLGSERQTFSNGRLAKYEYTTDWGVKVVLWFLNGQQEAVGTFSDGVNFLKYRIPSLKKQRLIIEEAIISALDRISTYNRYLFPEIWIEHFYLERYSPNNWPLVDFTDVLFNSRQGRIDFIRYLREKGASRE